MWKEIWCGEVCGLVDCGSVVVVIEAGRGKKMREEQPGALIT